MSAAELRRRRDAGELIRHGLAIATSEARRLLTIGAIVVIPANMIVSGIGLEQLWADYDDTVSTEASVIPVVLDYLVTLPLIVAMTVGLITTPGGSRSVGRAVSQGLEAYRSIFWAVLLAALGVAAGLLLLILPGIYLAIRWYFVTWVVVLEERRGPEALTRSGELVSGNWWRVLGIALLTSLIALVPTLVVVIPFEVIANATDVAAIALAGQTLSSIVVYPYVAVVGTLLYFDLRERKEGAAPPVVPPDPPGLPPRD